MQLGRISAIFLHSSILSREMNPYETRDDSPLDRSELCIFACYAKPERHQMNDQASTNAPGIAGLLVRIHNTVSVGTVLSLYWFLFWLLNGFDKFLNNDTFYGVNFKMALEGALLPSLGLDTSLASPLAAIVGIIEVVLGLLFLVSLLAFATRKPHRYEVANACIVLSVLFFALLTAGAILFGARDHVMTQGLFIGTLLVSGLTLHVSKKASD